MRRRLEESKGSMSSSFWRKTALSVLALPYLLTDTHWTISLSHFFSFLYTAQYLTPRVAMDSSQHI